MTNAELTYRSDSDAFKRHMDEAVDLLVQRVVAGIAIAAVAWLFSIFYL